MTFIFLSASIKQFIVQKQTKISIVSLHFVLVYRTYGEGTNE